MDKLQQLETHLRPSPKMPVLFVGHGSPMNAITDNDISREWARVGKNLPKPQAFVVISAHWLTHGVTKVTDAPKQPIIYDMYGFPDKLYKVKYNANGDPKLAVTLVEHMNSYEAKLDTSWGLDHGTWSVMKYLMPNPGKVPVLQISLDDTMDLPQIIKLFSVLKPLRKKGVLFIGSGNLVHNLAMLNRYGPREFDWAFEFDAKAADAMQNHDIAALTHPSKMTSAAQYAVQYDDHYRPMLAAMSLLDPTEQLSYFNDVFELGSLSMRSFISA